MLFMNAAQQLSQTNFFTFSDFRSYNILFAFKRFAYKNFKHETNYFNAHLLKLNVN